MRFTHIPVYIAITFCMEKREELIFDYFFSAFKWLNAWFTPYYLIYFASLGSFKNAFHKAFWGVYFFMYGVYPTFFHSKRTQTLT